MDTLFYNGQFILVVKIYKYLISCLLKILAYGLRVVFQICFHGQGIIKNKETKEKK